MFNDNCKIVIQKEMYAIARVKEYKGNLDFTPFAQIFDGTEWTFVLKEKYLENIEALSIEKGWKILTFCMNLPFETVGFLSRISTALAEASIPIFVISSYSTDHILIKYNYVPSAVRVLKEIGCEFKEE